MLRRLYDWTLDLAGHRHALAALAAVAFIESSIFPVPPDILIIPMVLAARTRAWRIAAVATAASALGGLAGYGIGAGLYEVVGRSIIEFYGLAERFQEISGHYNEWGALIVFTAGFSPIPYKVFTIASGVAGMNLAVFLVASIVSRGARFFLVAALLWYFGEPIRRFIERNLPLLTVVFCVMLVAGFIVLRYLF